MTHTHQTLVNAHQWGSRHVIWETDAAYTHIGRDGSLLDVGRIDQGMGVTGAYVVQVTDLPATPRTSAHDLAAMIDAAVSPLGGRATMEGTGGGCTAIIVRTSDAEYAPSLVLTDGDALAPLTLPDDYGLTTATETWSDGPYGMGTDYADLAEYHLADEQDVILTAIRHAVEWTRDHPSA